MKKLIAAKEEVIVKKAAQVIEEEGGLITLLGKTVMFHCMNYNYIGTLTGINTIDLELHEMHVVFETGPYTSNKMKDAQRVHSGVGFLKLASIESYWEVK